MMQGKAGSLNQLQLHQTSRMISNQMIQAGLMPEAKWPGRKAGHLPPTVPGL